ncbi:MAG: hypothetical protein KatS3mg129_1515 [Leptospiraceae bacterium]|nr:MAG: hypothetical protein KatS3mg129_1515 [Leptospiraceae bacterium]
MIVLEPILSKVFFVLMDFFKLFHQYLTLIDISLSSKELELFYEFYRILIEKNKEINFTRLQSLNDIIKKHFIDSIIVQKILENNQISLQEPLMDLGTGGGFPGIPLAIINPTLKILLVESRKNRVDYLFEVKEKLNLNNIEIFHKTLNYNNSIHCNGVITRALETIKETAIRTANSLEKNGLLIFLKGPNCEHEINEMNFKFFELILDYDYILPDINYSSKDKRKLIIFRKNIEKNILLEPVNRYYFKAVEKIPIKYISSHNNPFYKKIKKLEQSKEIKKQNQTLLAGKKIIKDFIENHAEKIISFIFNKNVNENEILNFYSLINKKNSHIDYIFMKNELLQGLELNSYKPPYLIAKTNTILPIEKFDFKSSFLILPLQDPTNLGACIRTAYAFGIKDIILTKESCNPYLLKAIRSSAGTVFHCNFYDLKQENRSSYLSNLKIPLFILDIQGKDIRTIHTNPSVFGLILGEEGRGIPEDLILNQTQKITIPMLNPVDSLNVSVACGIALFYLKLL